MISLYFKCIWHTKGLLPKAHKAACDNKHYNEEYYGKCNYPRCNIFSLLTFYNDIRIQIFQLYNLQYMSQEKGQGIVDFMLKDGN